MPQKYWLQFRLEDGTAVDCWEMSSLPMPGIEIVGLDRKRRMTAKIKRVTPHEYWEDWHVVWVEVKR